MRIQITGGGIYDGKGEELPIGSTFDVAEEPAGWAGRYTVLDGEKGSGEKTAVTNPADTQTTSVTAEELEAMTVSELKALAEDNNIDLQGATLKADIIAAIQLAAEPKA